MPGVWKDCGDLVLKKGARPSRFLTLPDVLGLLTKLLLQEVGTGPGSAVRMCPQQHSTALPALLSVSHWGVVIGP